MTQACLYLIPTPLGSAELATLLPIQVQERVRTLRYFVAEHPKTSRAFLKALGMSCPLQELHIETLNINTPNEVIATLINPLIAGHNIGLLSEAGCPAVADPGALLVRAAHQANIRVIPLVGPSSLLLGLMASGLNGQCFAFQGYAPQEVQARTQYLKQLEKFSAEQRQTQLLIETPYRNKGFYQALIDSLKPNTHLCIARGLTTANEFILTKTIAQWRASNPPPLEKIPTVFLFLAE